MEEYTVVKNNDNWHVVKDGTIVCALDSEKEARCLASTLSRSKNPTSQGVSVEEVQALRSSIQTPRNN